MKKIIQYIACLCLLVGLGQNLKAQEPLIYNLYHVNSFLLNPAATGFDGQLVGFLNYHNQWNDFGKAPAVMTFGVHSPIVGNSSLGANVIKDNRTAFTHTYANLFYSYKLMLSSDQFLALGVSGGFVDNNFDQTQVIAPDVSDPLYQASYYKHTGFAAGAGLMYAYKSFLFQASAPQLIDRNKNLIGQYNFGASYQMSVNQLLELRPSVMYRTFPTSIPQVDVNVMGIWNKMFRGQLAYRTDQSMIVSVGVGYKAFEIDYAYQLNVGPINSLARGTHEIQLAIHFGKVKQKETPQPNLKPDTIVVKEVKHDTIKIAKVDTVYKFKDNPNATPQADYMTPEELKNLSAEELRTLKIEKQYYPIPDIKKMLNAGKSVIGLKLKLPHINFVTDKSELLKESVIIIDSVVSLMKEYPQVRIQVSGHTDSQASDAYNLKLSKNRATAVYQYMTAKGIDGKRLEHEGYGEARPIQTNATPEGRHENRRVDFMFIK